MALHGKDTTFSIDNSAAAPTDISEYCDNVDFPGLNTDVAETTGFTAGSKSFVPGLKNGTFSISGAWDAVVDAVLAGIVGKEGSFSYAPGGGAVTYSGEAICTAYQISSPLNDKITFSASFQISGDVTRT